jgi:hypothetical protein
VRKNNKPSAEHVLSQVPVIPLSNRPLLTDIASQSPVSAVSAKSLRFPDRLAAIGKKQHGG